MNIFLSLEFALSLMLLAGVVALFSFLVFGPYFFLFFLVFIGGAGLITYAKESLKRNQ
jgi:hypothetical protein